MVTERPDGIRIVRISTPEEAASVAAISDAVIVGSKFSTLIEAAADPAQAVGAVAALCGDLKRATRRAST